MTTHPMSLTWYTLNATVANSYINLRCQVQAFSPDDAVQRLEAFMVGVHGWGDEMTPIVTLEAQ